MTLDDLTHAFGQYRCPAPLTPGQGYQMAIAADLEQYLERALGRNEFRPNYEKDLVKFQIGQNSGLLAAGVMVVAVDRKTINPQPPLYPSIPEYRSVVSVVRQLSPQYPLLVIGVLGAHAP